MKNNELVRWLLILSVLLSSCGIQRDLFSDKKKIITTKKDIKNKQEPKLYEVIAKEIYGGKDEKSYSIIKNKEDLIAFNKEISLNEQEVTLNFKKSNLLVLFMGQKNSGGYAIDVADVTEGKDTVCIKVNETVPQKADATTMVITNPYCIVVVNSKKEIIIQDQ